ncbi:MAG: hypothetical protein QM479_14895 [Pseudomonadota bacterium]
MKLLMAVFLSNLLPLLVLFSGSLAAQNNTRIETNPVEQQTAALANQGVHIPLYLSLIEFSPLDAEQVAKVQLQLEKKKSVKLQQNLHLKAFHQRNNNKLNTNNHNSLKPQLATTNLSFCSTCHRLLPHQNNVRSRSFNNMHSRYIACETCHLDKAKLNQQLLETVNNLEYRWFDFFNRRELKSPEGLFSDPKLQNNPFNQLKITPFFKQKVVVISRLHLYAKMLEENWKAADQHLQAEIKVRTHLYIKAQGETCEQCHKQPGSLLDLLALGASKKQLQMYTQNNIANFFSRYKDTFDKNNILAEKNSAEKALSPDEKQKKIQRIRITELLN